MKVHSDIEQGTPEWFALRLGRITGTGYQSVQAGGQGKMRTAYMKRLRSERIYGVPCGSDYKNGHMERGTELEPQAISAYEDNQYCIVERVGFISDGEWIGFSPDGLIGDDGGVEVKCPMLTTHVDYIESGKLPSDYKWQVHFAMALTGRKWWDFVSYHPDAYNDERDDRLFILKVDRDEKICDNIKYECDRFIEELKASINKITGKE